MMQPKDELGRFSFKGSKPLAKKIIGIRLPQDIYDELMKAHPSDYTDWIREVIASSLKAENNDGAIN
ncbi:hypothetical protein LC593_33630 [Nostoc sp. CHAB 5844]|nr:hypothetical protein [Nostoc sp. CHAB 5844]